MVLALLPSWPSSLLGQDNDSMRLELDLRHALAVGLGVEKSLSEQDWVLFRRDKELVVECMMPSFLHVIPVSDDAVLNGVLKRKDATLGLCLIIDIAVLLVHTAHGVRQAFHFMAFMAFVAGAAGFFFNFKLSGCNGNGTLTLRQAMNCSTRRAKQIPMA